MFSSAHGKCGEDAGELGIQPRESPGRGRLFRQRFRIAHHIHQVTRDHDLGIPWFERHDVAQVCLWHKHVIECNKALQGWPAQNPCNRTLQTGINPLTDNALGCINSTSPSRSRVSQRFIPSEKGRCGRLTLSPRRKVNRRERRDRLIQSGRGRTA